MNGQIIVEPAELRSAAGAFDSIGVEVSSLTSQMMETINAITENVWSGDAATTYKNKFTGMQEDIRKLCGMVKEHAADLQEMAKQYEVAEETNKELAASLSENIIS